jgi:hypothetical protein
MKITMPGLKPPGGCPSDEPLCKRCYGSRMGIHSTVPAFATASGPAAQKIRAVAAGRVFHPGPAVAHHGSVRLVDWRDRLFNRRHGRKWLRIIRTGIYRRAHRSFSLSATKTRRSNVPQDIMRPCKHGSGTKFASLCGPLTDQWRTRGEERSRMPVCAFCRPMSGESCIDSAG